MKYRIFGRTGLNISEVGFGCGNNAVLMIHGTHEEQLKAVGRALELGVNYFDTAFTYGMGKSEENLGMVLNELNPSVVVSTKIRIVPEDLSDLRSATIRAVDAGLKRLRRKSVDLIQLHNKVTRERISERHISLTPGDILGPGGVLDGLKEVRDEGKARFLGFCGLGEPEAFLEVIDSGEFDSVQAYYNLLNPSAGQPVPKGFSALDYRRLIDRAAGKGMGIAVIRVLALGALTAHPEAGGGNKPEPLSPGSDYAVDVKRASQLTFLPDKKDRSLAQSAIRFALMKPEVSTVLIGFSNIAHIEEAVACSGTGGLPDETMSRMERVWETDFGRIH